MFAISWKYQHKRIRHLCVRARFVGLSICLHVNWNKRVLSFAMCIIRFTSFTSIRIFISVSFRLSLCFVYSTNTLDDQALLFDIISKAWRTHFTCEVFKFIRMLFVLSSLPCPVPLILSLSTLPLKWSTYFYWAFEYFVSMRQNSRYNCFFFCKRNTKRIKKSQKTSRKQFNFGI